MSTVLTSQYRYKIEMTYLDTVKNKPTKIRTECIKSIIIDRNYTDNSMPIIYASLKLDRALMDDMILNSNHNLIILIIYKYDNLIDFKEEIEVFKDKFIYYTPDSVNKNNNIDYTDDSSEEHLGNTFREALFGMISIDMINRNKRLIEINSTSISMYDCIKYCLNGFNNVIIEPFHNDENMSRFIMPTQESVNKAIRYLNSYKVFYNSPYIFFQDFDYTYLVSSNAYQFNKLNETYSSVIIKIKDIDDKSANDIGQILNNESKTYEVIVSFSNTILYNNSIINKSIDKIRGITSTGNTEVELKNKDSYSINEKTKLVRLNNDNTNMLSNIEAYNNNNSVFLYITKNDLDLDLFSLNKRISVENIDRYKEYNGNYMMTRKRELLLREDDTFIAMTMLNMKLIG